MKKSVVIISHKSGDNWSYKVPVKLSPPKKPTPSFLQDGYPSCRPTNSVQCQSTTGKVSFIIFLIFFQPPSGFHLTSQHFQSHVWFRRSGLLKQYLQRRARCTLWRPTVSSIEE